MIETSDVPGTADAGASVPSTLPGAAPKAGLGRRTVRRMTDVLVACVGVAGGVCVVAWLVARALGLSLVVLTTGSMSPTIPAGGVAVTREVPADELVAGDVVTVPRPGADLPVTHRVVAVDDVADGSEARSLTLRGDANDTDDRAPYVVTEAERVVVSAPSGGALLAAVTSPTGRGAVVVLVGLCVVVAFWPTRVAARPPSRA